MSEYFSDLTDGQLIRKRQVSSAPRSVSISHEEKSRGDLVFPLNPSMLPRPETPTESSRNIFFSPFIFLHVPGLTP